MNSHTRCRVHHGLAAALLVMASLASPVASAQPLDALLKAALSHPDAQSAASEVAAAERALSAETLRYAGSGSLQADWNQFKDPTFAGAFTENAFAAPPFAEDVLHYGARWELPIDLAGVIRASRDAARNDLDAAKLAERQVQLKKMHDVLMNWSQVIALRQQQQVLALSDERSALTEARVERELQTGAASRSDLALVRAERARLKAEQIRIDGQQQQLLATIEELTGLQASEFAAAIPHPMGLATPGDAADLLPVQLAAAKAAAADAEAKQFSRSLWPSVGISGQIDDYDADVAVDDSWRVGVGVSLPIDPSAWTRKSAVSAQAQAAADSAQAARRGAALQLQSLQLAARSADADAAAIEREIDARQGVVEMQVELERVGLISVEDVLRQRRDLADAEARLSAARLRWLGAWSALQLLNGVSSDDYLAGLR